MGVLQGWCGGVVRMVVVVWGWCGGGVGGVGGKTHGLIPNVCMVCA